MIENRHRFETLTNECEIQGVPVNEAAKTLVLMTHPRDRYRQYMDNYANHTPAPTADVIFAGMKVLEERNEARQDVEHGEATYASWGTGGCNGGGGGRNKGDKGSQPRGGSQEEGAARL